MGWDDREPKVYLWCSKEVDAPQNVVVESGFVPVMEWFRSKEMWRVREWPIPPEGKMDAVQLEVGKCSYVIFLDIRRVDIGSESIYLCQGCGSRTRFMSKTVAKLFVVSHSYMQCLTSDAGKHGSFWGVCNINSQWGITPSLVTQRIYHYLPMSSSGFEACTNDVKTVVEDLVFNAYFGPGLRILDMGVRLAGGRHSTMPSFSPQSEYSPSWVEADMQPDCQSSQILLSCQRRELSPRQLHLVARGSVICISQRITKDYQKLTCISHALSAVIHSLYTCSNFSAVL